MLASLWSNKSENSIILMSVSFLVRFWATVTVNPSCSKRLLRQAVSAADPYLGENLFVSTRWQVTFERFSSTTNWRLSPEDLQHTFVYKTMGRQRSRYLWWGQDLLVWQPWGKPCLCLWKTPVLVSLQLGRCYPLCFQAIMFFQLKPKRSCRNFVVVTDWLSHYCRVQLHMHCVYVSLAYQLNPCAYI